MTSAGGLYFVQPFFFLNYWNFDIFYVWYLAKIGHLSKGIESETLFYWAKLNPNCHDTPRGGGGGVLWGENWPGFWPFFHGHIVLNLFLLPKTKTNRPPSPPGGGGGVMCCENGPCFEPFYSQFAHAKSQFYIMPTNFLSLAFVNDIWQLVPTIVPKFSAK